MDVVTSPPPVNTAVIVANAASVSGTVNCAQGRLLGIGIPAAIDGTTLTFRVSADGVNFMNLYNADGTEYSVVMAAGHAILLAAADFYGFQYVQVRTGTGASPTAQTAQRTLTLFQAA